MRVGSGSLYRSLDVMLTAGLIDETRGTVDDAPELRRLFRLTDLGERIARAETARLAHLVAVARRTPRLWDDPRRAPSSFPRPITPQPVTPRIAPTGERSPNHAHNTHDTAARNDTGARDRWSGH